MVSRRWQLDLIVVHLAVILCFRTGRTQVPAVSRSPPVVRHPGTCTFQRSQPACTFSLLCYLAGGIPTEGCGGVLQTCCTLPKAVVSTRRSRPPPPPPPPQAPHHHLPSSHSRSFGPSDDICGIIAVKPQNRIIGGQDAHYGEFPWQAHIKISRHQCGGALVSSRSIVTAAHCVYQAPLNQLSVVLGAWDISDQRYQSLPAQVFSVSEVIVHPDFRFSASHPDRFDVAIVRLDRPAHYQEHVLPACLPPSGFNFEGWYGVVTGWGKTDPAISNRYGTRVLQKVEVPIIRNDECELWHHTRGINLRIFPEMMCAGYENGQKDACVGDSGGPLVAYFNGRWTLVGITSAGFGCAQSRQPGIYHRVSVTVDWIIANLR